MAPKQPNKRKVSSSSGDEEVEVAPTKKGKNASKEKSSEAPKEGFASNGQPTNKLLPERIEFPKKHDGALRIATWNVSGLAACQKKVRRFVSVGVGETNKSVIRTYFG